jgi:hypothetical protein
MNAFKTGIHAQSLVLPSENLADLEQLTEDYYLHHQPATPDARGLVDELIYCEWMLRRLRAAETQAWQYQTDDKYRDPPKYPLGQSVTCHSTTFSKLQYRLDATRRARLRTLDALAKLQAEAAASPAPAPALEPAAEAAEPPSLPPSPQTTSPQIGFVPSTPSTAPPQPAPRGPSPGPNRPETVGTEDAQRHCHGQPFHSAPAIHVARRVAAWPRVPPAIKL